MTPADFVQWLRGFLDAIDGQPTSVQLEKIRERLTGVQAISVGAIDFTKLTRKDFVLPTTPYVSPRPTWPMHYYDGNTFTLPFGGNGTWCYDVNGIYKSGAAVGGGTIVGGVLESTWGTLAGGQS